MNDKKTLILLIYGIYLLALSVITFFTYYADKKKAKRGAWRVKESALLAMSFFGGAYGGFAAMQLLRHKTKAEHWYFTAVNVLGILIHTALIIMILFVFKF